MKRSCINLTHTWNELENELWYTYKKKCVILSDSWCIRATHIAIFKFTFTHMPNMYEVNIESKINKNYFSFSIADTQHMVSSLIIYFVDVKYNNKKLGLEFRTTILSLANTYSTLNWTSKAVLHNYAIPYILSERCIVKNNKLNISIILWMIVLHYTMTNHNGAAQ